MQPEKYFERVPSIVSAALIEGRGVLVFDTQTRALSLNGVNASAHKLLLYFSRSFMETLLPHFTIHPHLLFRGIHLGRGKKKGCKNRKSPMTSHFDVDRAKCFASRFIN